LTEIQENDKNIPVQEFFPIAYKTSAKLTVTFTFFVVLALGLLGFVMLRMAIAESMGQEAFAIDIFSVSILIVGSMSLTYLYYKRYAKRELIITKESCTLIVGNRSYDYTWKEFTIVALSVSPSSTGIKGFVIRLYESDLDGEYVDLPVYRFPKKVDVFELRREIDAIVRPRDRKIII
jgi:hypothetical protein